MMHGVPWKRGWDDGSRTIELKREIFSGVIGDAVFV